MRMRNRKRYFICLIALLLVTLPLTAQEQESQEESEKEWMVGLSVLSPALPVGIKAVRTDGLWGFQLEANYFYSVGVFRIDGRRTVRKLRRIDLYGFAGITFMHFNDGVDMNNSLMADLGAGAVWHLGKKLSLGAEGGLLVPFYSNQGLEQYDNSGLMVANAYLTYRL